ncbi:unnamed protein product, partial [Staurois parvus]
VRRASPGWSRGQQSKYHWCQWENSAPSFVISGRNSAPSLVSVGGIVPHHWYQWEE